MTDRLKKTDAWLEQTVQRLKTKEVTFPSALVGGVVFLVVAGVLWLMMPGQVQVADSDVINGRAFPTLLIVILTVCCILLIAGECIKIAKKQPLQTVTVNLLVEIKAVIIFAIMLLFFFLAKYVHFAVGAVVAAIGMTLFFRCKKPLYYAISVTAALVIWAAFEFGLGVRF